jgi:2-oxoglutarate ferredoxin oxidoreductase subunit alpha
LPRFGGDVLLKEMICVGLRDDTVSILIGGEAGQGITRSGSLLGTALMRGGLNVFGTNEYPSLIRGGHNYYLLRASGREVYSQDSHVELVVALNKETALIHQGELIPGGGIILDEALQFTEGELSRGDVKLYPVPLTTMVKELGGPEVVRNTVALGSVLALVGFDHAILKDVIAETFKGRQELIEMNRKAVDMGYNYCRERYEGFGCRLEDGEEAPRRIMPTGDDAVALGAIQAGCKFYAAYPMTPASPILDYMAAHDAETEMAVIQTESEIAAINMVVGAGYAGLRAMTATSGGGFSLMTEAFGFAAMTETPVVVNVGQRPGPSTGLATNTAQGDLLFAIHASQGEFPRIVVAPGDIEECFYITMEAFNLAERFQVPVIILTDKYLAESHRSVEPFDPKRIPVDRGKLTVVDEWRGEEYGRYKITGDCVSPRLLPGTLNAVVQGNSNEHDELGYSTSSPGPVMAMMDKRLGKRRFIESEIASLKPVRVVGYEDAEVTLFGWGSTKGPAREALELLSEAGVKARFVQVVYLEPFPGEEVRRELAKGSTNVLFENNATAQLGELIRLHASYGFDHVGLRYDGRPFNPSDIRDKVMEVLGR